MKYTFLLPAYKGRFLDEMLQSIQRQTYKDFKVVISDDCSPEDLHTICKPYLKDPRFTYRRNEENMGSKDLVAHWNMLVNMCDTEFLIMASDDDVYEPEFLEEIDKLTLKYPHVDLFRARVRRIDENGTLLAKDILADEYMDSLQYIYQSHCNYFISCEATNVYRVEALKANGGFIDFPLAWHTDYATCFLLSKKGCCSTKDILFSFRMSEQNITSQWGDSNDSREKVEASIKYWSWMNDFLGCFHENDSAYEINMINAIKDNCKMKMCGHIQNHIYHLPYCLFRKYVRLIPSELGLSKKRMLLHYLRTKI